jgi:hypothetical protein
LSPPVNIAEAQSTEFELAGSKRHSVALLARVHGYWREELAGTPDQKIGAE